MNRSWSNNTSASPGFVYFNVNNSFRNESTDFVPFNNSLNYGSPECNRFSPVNCSSPVKYQKQGTFNGRQTGRNGFRYHNNQNTGSFNNSPKSFNSSFKNSRKKKSGYQHTQNNSSFNSSGKRDVSMYFDPTCVKDPWAELEQKLKETQMTEVNTDNSSCSEKQENEVSNETCTEQSAHETS